MNKKDAYRYVFHDMVSFGPKMFIGIYDAKNGSDKFMYGVQMVMEFIACNASDEILQAFTEIFADNMIESSSKHNNADSLDS